MQLRLDKRVIFSSLEEYLTDELINIIMNFFDTCQCCGIVFDNICFSKQDIHDPLYISNKLEQERLRESIEKGNFQEEESNLQETVDWQEKHSQIYETQEDEEMKDEMDWFIQVWPSSDCGCGAVFCSDECRESHYVKESCLCSNKRKLCPNFKCAVCGLIECDICGMTCRTCRRSGHKKCLNGKSCDILSLNSSDCWHCGEEDCYSKWISHNLTILLSSVHEAVQKVETFLNDYPLDLEMLPLLKRSALENTLSHFQTAAECLQAVHVPVFAGPFHPENQ